MKSKNMDKNLFEMNKMSKNLIKQGLERYFYFKKFKLL